MCFTAQKEGRHPNTVIPLNFLPSPRTNFLPPHDPCVTPSLLFAAGPPVSDQTGDCKQRFRLSVFVAAFEASSAKAAVMQGAHRIGWSLGDDAVGNHTETQTASLSGIPLPAPADDDSWNPVPLVCVAAALVACVGVFRVCKWRCEVRRQRFEQDRLWIAQMLTWESGKRDFLEVGEQEAAAVGPARSSDAICWDV